MGNAPTDPMTDRRTALKTIAGLSAARLAQGLPQPTAASDRIYWTGLLTRLAEPVLENLARGTLKRNMPVESASENQFARRKYSHLEAIARLLTGIAPWLEAPLEAGAERDLQQRYAALARAAIRSATDPQSPDFLNFSDGGQPLVDCGFLSQALLRAPAELWKKLDRTTQRNLAAALLSSRAIVPNDSNWLLFSAIVETGLAMMGESWDATRIDYALRKHEEWFVGDGLYGDGPHFHWDYYNSFVIQPMLLDTLRNIRPYSSRWQALLPDVLVRAAVRGYPGAADCAGRHLSRHRPLHRLPLRRLSSVGPDGARARATRSVDRPAGPLRFDGGDAPADGSAGNVRSGRLAAYRVLRAPAQIGRELHLDRQFVSLLCGAASAGARPGRSVLGGARAKLDFAPDMER